MGTHILIMTGLFTLCNCAISLLSLNIYRLCDFLAFCKFLPLNEPMKWNHRTMQSGTNWCHLSLIPVLMTELPPLHGWNIADTAFNSIETINQWWQNFKSISKCSICVYLNQYKFKFMQLWYGKIFFLSTLFYELYLR